MHVCVQREPARRLAHTPPDAVPAPVQIACRKQFEARYPGGDSTNVGNHPNAYAEAAHKALRGDTPTAPTFAAGSSKAAPVAPGTAAPAGGAPLPTAADGAAGAGAVAGLGDDVDFAALAEM